MALAEQDRVDQAQAAAALPMAASLPFLLESLGDESWRVRAAAVESLASLRPVQEVASRLVESLVEPEDTGRRNAAVSALAQLGSAAIGAVAAVLHHPDAQRRKLAADTLGLVGLGEAVAPLTSSLLDPDANVRAAVAEALGRIGDGLAIEALSHHLAERRPEDPLEAATVLWALARARVQVDMKVLEAWLKAPLTRGAALSLAAHSADWAAPAALLDALGSNLPTPRIAAVRAMVHAGAHAPACVSLLASPGGREAVQAAALSLLANRDDEIAGGAAAVAAWSSTPTTASQLLSNRQGRAWDAAVARAWGAHGPEASIHVAAVLKRLEPEDQALALDLMSLHAAPGCAPALEAVMQSAHGETLELAARALLASDAALGVKALANRAGPDALEPEDGPAAERLLLQAASSHPHLVRAATVAQAQALPHAARLFAAAAGAEDRDTLRDLLRHRRPEIRAAACDGLARAGQPADADALLPLLLDEAPRVRAAAAHALGRVGKPVHLEQLAARALDGDVDVMAAALESMAVLDAARARSLVVERCGDPRSSVAVRALAVAERMAPEIALQAGLGAVQSTDGEVARAAVRTLAASAVPLAEETLAAMLRDARWEIRHAAAQGLGRVWERLEPSSAAVGRARDCVAGEQDALVREALETALGQVRG